MILRVLFDGLWQGAAVFALAYPIARSIPRNNATTRCAVWFAALLALVVVPLLTAFSSPGAVLFDALRPHAAAGTWTIFLLPASARTNGTPEFFAMANRWLVGAWAAGAGLCLTRLGASLLRIRRIRRGAAAMPALGGDVLVSAEVVIPIAVGIFRPAIVIPEGLLTTLVPADLERVIAHERAHVRRYDVAANLVQRLIEAVLFFNPWVHLAGRQLVLEREAACDDWAIGKTGSPAAYAACLGSLAERLRQPRVPLATPSALPSRHALVERIERLVESAPPAIRLNYYAIGGTVMLFAVLTLVLQAFSPALALSSAHSASALNGGRGLLAAACADPNAEARYLDGPAPAIPHGLKPKGTATIMVTVASNGMVVRASTLKSSGSAQVDRAVLEAAMHGKYAPKRVNCKPVASDYLFRATFGPNGQ